MPRRPAAAAAALLVALLAACGDGDRGPAPAARDSASPGPEATTTTSPSATTTTAVAGGRPTTTVRPTTTTGAAPAPTTTTAAPAGVRPLTPAAPGTYRFDTAGTTTVAGSTFAFPAVTTLVVDPPSGTRQRLVRNLRDGAGNGLATELTLDYRPDGVFLDVLRVTTGFGGVTDVRELRPASPVLLLATGARPGAHLEADVGGPAAARLVADVLREEPVTVAGRVVDTLAVRVVVTLGPGDVTGRQELTLNVDRGSRLWVRERSVADASAGGGLFTLHSEYTATLQRLTP